RIVLASTVAATLIFGLEAVFGLESPTQGGARRRGAYWRWLGRLPGRRNWIVGDLRIAQISDLLTRYFQQVAVGVSAVAPLRAWMQRHLYYRDERPVVDESVPATVRLMLQDLGPTFVKFGQIVSSRAEALPPEWRDELVKLQSNVAPFPYPE